MANVKLHKTPNLGIEKPYGNIDAHKVSRLGIPFNSSANDFENSYISNVPIKIKKLISDLSSNHFENNEFDAKNYIDHDAIKRAREEANKVRKEAIIKKRIKLFEKIRDNIPQNKPYQQQPQTEFKPLSEQEIENINYSLLSSSLSLNTTVSNIDNRAHKNEYNIYADQFGNLISYDYCIYYKASEQTNNRNKAILLNSSDPGILFFFIEKVYGKAEVDKLRKDIFNKFIKKLEKAKAIEHLIFLHENLPHYIKYAYDIDKETGRKLYKLPDELLWKNFMFFVNFDKWDDASYYVLYIMTLITPKYCIQQFLKDPSLVIQVYDGLDDRNLFDRLIGDYKYSETFSIGKKTLVPSNKDVFVTLLNSYIQLHENDASVTIFESSGAHFHQGDIMQGDMNQRGDYKGKYWLNSGTEKDKIYLKNNWEVKRNLGDYLGANGKVYTDYEYPSGYNEEGHYNPLHVVKFTQYNDKGEAITTNVPVILVYHADYVEDWKRIHEGIRFGVNVLMIAVGAVTIYSGVGSLMLYATIADMGLATTDIIIQGKVKKGHFESEAGKEFLESWEKIYTIGGVATFSPVAIKFVATYGPKIASAGADLLQVTRKMITNPDTYKKVKDFTTKAIHSIEIPNFNKTGLQILKKGFDNIPELTGAIKLQDLGVIFVKGAENTYAAIYKGVTIAYGEAKMVALQLRRALQKLRGKQLDEYLDELVELAGMAENVKTTRNVDAFLASVARLEKIKITSKNALKYLDEALPHFNHKVVDGEVVKLAEYNCTSTVQVVEEFLRTGKITKAKYVSELEGTDITILIEKYGGQFNPTKLLPLGKSMKEGERGIIYGITKRRTFVEPNGELKLYTDGHVFNVIKKDGVLLYKDGQIGRDTIFPFKHYKEFQYLKTN